MNAINQKARCSISWAQRNQGWMLLQCCCCWNETASQTNGPSAERKEMTNPLQEKERVISNLLLHQGFLHSFFSLVSSRYFMVRQLPGHKTTYVLRTRGEKTLFILISKEYHKNKRKLGAYSILETGAKNIKKNSPTDRPTFSYPFFPEARPNHRAQWGISFFLFFSFLVFFSSSPNTSALKKRKRRKK